MTEPASPRSDPGPRSAALLACCGRVLFLLALAADALAKPAGWRSNGTGDFPLADPPLEWSRTHNVRWMTRMPSWSNATPVVVGDRLFVTAEPDLLVCLDAWDGRILWQRVSPVEDAIPVGAAGPAFLQATARLHETRAVLRAKELELTALRRTVSGPPDDPARARALRELAAETRGLHDQLAAFASVVKLNVNSEAGFSSPSPASDGRAVFVVFATGIAASYDLDGGRRWIRFVDHPESRDGLSSSPVLAGGKLLLLLDDLLALDPASGDVEWRVPSAGRQGTPLAFQIEGHEVVVTPSGDCVRVADGTVLATGLGDLDYASPVVHDGVLYMVQETAKAFRIPGQMTGALRFEPLWNARLKGARYYASPLVSDGLLYTVERNRYLTVLDAASGERVYVERVDLGPMGGANGAFASPARAGRHVFVSGLGGTTLVLEPGRRFQLVATNQLEKFRASLVFEGDRIFVRTHENVFCIMRGADGGHRR